MTQKWFYIFLFKVSIVVSVTDFSHQKQVGFNNVESLECVTESGRSRIAGSHTAQNQRPLMRL